jgi:hypothetical protein
MNSNIITIVETVQDTILDNNNQTINADEAPEAPEALEVIVQKSKRGRKPNSLNKKTLEQNKLNAAKNNIQNNIDVAITNTNDLTNENNIDLTAETETETESDIKPLPKKRGRKPKGGKIIHNVIIDNSNKIEKPNIILHLKCFLKDLNCPIENSIDNIDSYKFPSKNNLLYDVINNEDTSSIIDNTISTSSITASSTGSNTNTFLSQKPNNKIIHVINTTQPSNHTYNPNIEIHTDVHAHTNTNDSKEIYRKLKDLELNLHLNNIQDKKSACFWCTCDFDNPPIYIPKHYLKESYHVYGCFCTPECGVAYLMNENIDSSIKFERYHLMNHIYAKVYNYTKNIKPSPSPFYMLEKYYGNLSINEYRALIRNDRLFLIVDKPLTRIMPELHVDNEDFIINNKIISTNNFQINKKSHKMSGNAQSKNSIIGETFGFNTNS